MQKTKKKVTVTFETSIEATGSENQFCSIDCPHYARNANLLGEESIKHFCNLFFKPLISNHVSTLLEEQKTGKHIRADTDNRCTECKYLDYDIIISTR